MTGYKSHLSMLLESSTQSGVCCLRDSGMGGKWIPLCERCLENWNWVPKIAIVGVIASGLTAI